MKNLLIGFLVLSFLIPFILADSKIIKIKGFYLGMEKSEVKLVYEKLKTGKVAKYISIENEKYRDMIKLDNEFGSMGNKIDIFYSEKEKVTGITFQYKTVNVLFKAEKLSADEFVKGFEREFQLPRMSYRDMGMVKTWTHVDKNLKLKISIDNSKNLRLKNLSN